MEKNVQMCDSFVSADSGALDIYLLRNEGVKSKC